MKSCDPQASPPPSSANLQCVVALRRVATLCCLSLLSTAAPLSKDYHPGFSPRLSAFTPPAATMSADERLDGNDADLVARHCGAGHPVQLPAALHDSVGSRFPDALRKPAPVEDTPEWPPRRKRPRPAPSRPRPSRARRPPVVRDSSSEHSSEVGPMNLFNDHAGSMGGGNSGGRGGGEGGHGGGASAGGGGDDDGGGGGGGHDGGGGAGLGSGVGGDGSGAAARRTALTDEPDNRPGALAAVDRYADMMAVELVVVLCGAERTAGALSPIYRLVAVGGGGAVVVGEVERSIVTWPTRSRGRCFCLCSRGGRSGAEALEMREWMSKATNCLHARALHKTIQSLLVRYNEESLDALLRRHPVLDNSSTPSASDRQVFYATKTQNKRGISAVLSSGVWCAVSVRPRTGRKSAKKGRVMRPAGTSLSCNDHWQCKHAKAVNDWCAEVQRAAGLAGGAGAPALVQNADVVLAQPMGRKRRPLVAEAARVAAQAEADARYSNESRWRGARNLLPCHGELDVCERYDRVAEQAAHGSIPRLEGVLYEDTCFKCGAGYRAAAAKYSGGILHTLRGRIYVSMHQWKCTCGTVVFFDGAQHGLFASTTQTAFTRTLVDIVS